MKKPLSLVIVLIALATFLSVAWRESDASVQTGKSKGGGVVASYKQHCAKCHADDGKGIESLQPPDFTDGKWQADNTDKMIADGIRNGKGVMPGFKETMSPAQVNSMVKFVRAFGPKAAKSEKK
ncbi:MAG: c-type cytochrome [Acidobacteria bacterium]|nr:c-type cytochrome [Acidobacteriota bacterium]